MGSNSKGQLGINDPQIITKRSPILVETLVGKYATEVFCGERHTLALSKNGEVYSWGDNEFGQTGSGGYQVNTIYSPRMVNLKS